MFLHETVSTSAYCNEEEKTLDISSRENLASYRALTSILSQTYCEIHGWTSMWITEPWWMHGLGRKECIFQQNDQEIVLEYNAIEHLPSHYLHSIW